MQEDERYVLHAYEIWVHRAIELSLSAFDAWCSMSLWGTINHGSLLPLDTAFLQTQGEKATLEKASPCLSTQLRKFICPCVHYKLELYLEDWWGDSQLGDKMGERHELIGERSTMHQGDSLDSGTACDLEKGWPLPAVRKIIISRFVHSWGSASMTIRPLFAGIHVVIAAIYWRCILLLENCKKGCNFKGNI